jgi:hypothetical protein
MTWENNFFLVEPAKNIDALFVAADRSDHSVLVTRQRRCGIECITWIDPHLPARQHLAHDADGRHLRRWLRQKLVERVDVKSGLLRVQEAFVDNGAAGNVIIQASKVIVSEPEPFRGLARRFLKVQVDEQSPKATPENVLAAICGERADEATLGGDIGVKGGGTWQDRGKGRRRAKVSGQPPLLCLYFSRCIILFLRRSRMSFIRGPVLLVMVLAWKRVP